MHVLLPFPYHRWFFGLVVLVLLVAPYPLWAPPMGLMRFGRCHCAHAALSKQTAAWRLPCLRKDRKTWVNGWLMGY